MAGLKIVSDRLDDNSLKYAIVLGPRRNGEVNFGAAEAINRALLMISPDAYDPEELPAALQPVMVELADGVVATRGGIFPGVIIPADLAQAAMRDGAIPADDDEVVFPRACPTGGCGDE